MNKEKLAALVFGTLLGWTAVGFTVAEVQNKLIWLLVFPLLAWPAVAWKSERAGGAMAFLYSAVSVALYLLGFLRVGRSVQSLARFLLGLPLPAVLIGLLLMYSASKQKEADRQRWANVVAETAGRQPPQRGGIGQWMRK